MTKSVLGSWVYLDTTSTDSSTVRFSHHLQTQCDMRALWRGFKNQQKKGKNLAGAYLTCGPVCSSPASPQSTPGRSCWVVWSVCALQWTQCHTGWRPPARRRCTSCEGGRQCAWSRTWPASRSERCTSRWRRDICTPESWSASPPGKETRPVTHTAHDLWICHLTILAQF